MALQSFLTDLIRDALLLVRCSPVLLLVFPPTVPHSIALRAADKILCGAAHGAAVTRALYCTELAVSRQQALLRSAVGLVLALPQGCAELCLPAPPTLERHRKGAPLNSFGVWREEVSCCWI